MSEVENKNSKENLRAKLRERLQEKQFGRQTKFSRENMFTKLESMLKKTESSEQKNKLQTKLNLLEKVEENEFNAATNNDMTNDSVID